MNDSRSNELLVLLPGLHGTGDLFYPLLNALSKPVTTLVIEYPRHEKMSYAALSDFVYQRLPEDKDYVLVAESFSGPIAYRVALRNPPCLKKVVYVASFLSIPNRLISVARLFPFIFSVDLPTALIHRYLFDKQQKTLLNRFRQTLRSIEPDVLSYRLNQILSLPRASELSHIRSIYIQATMDKLVAARCVKVFENVCSQLTVHTIAGPHFLLQNNPIDCARLICSDTD